MLSVFNVLPSADNQLLLVFIKYDVFKEAESFSLELFAYKVMIDILLKLS